ncbi:hypothetical protein EP331_01615 [bacterium]|nr:MAG: hypothetical protein EP331_01615 [bacterium]
MIHKIIETEAKSSIQRQLLIDISQAALHTRFLSKKPHFSVHINEYMIDVLINSEAFRNDTILKETAIDTGMLINQIRTVIINLGYNPVIDFQMIETNLVRIARISIGQSIENHLQRRLQIGYDMHHAESYSHLPIQDQLLAELQGRLIDKQLYIQKINPVQPLDNQLFGVIGAFYHLGGWIEVGMATNRSITETNNKKRVHLYAASGLRVPFEVPVHDRQRGRTLLLTINNNGDKSASKAYDLLDYLI